MKAVRILTFVELLDGHDTAVAAGDVLHLEDALVDYLIRAGQGEEIPYFEAIRFIGPGFAGFQEGETVRVAWSPTDPDVRTSQEVELEAVAHFCQVFRERGASEGEIREALRQSQRYGIYAEFDELPDPTPTSRRDGPLRVSEALAAIDGGFAEPIADEQDTTRR